MNIEYYFTTILNSSNINNINSAAKIINNTLENYLHFHQQMSPQKANLFGDIFQLFKVLKVEKDNIKIKNTINEIKNKYNVYNSIPVTYLFRHPEKFDPNRTKREATNERALTEYGVKQAKEFADSLMEEILITNAPVKLLINYSPYKRTKLFAEIIKFKAESIKNNYAKNILISFEEEIAISGDQVTADGKLDQWIKSKNAVQNSALIENWFTSKTHSSGYYTINVGITHLPNLAAFLVHKLNLDYSKAEKFRYADFIKFENSRYYYNGEWL